MGLTIHLFFGYYTLNAQPWAAHGNILVDPQNPHYLQYTDGTPFFGWVIQGGKCYTGLIGRE